MPAFGIIEKFAFAFLLFLFFFFKPPLWVVHYWIEFTELMRKEIPYCLLWIDILMVPHMHSKKEVLLTLGVWYSRWLQK